MRQCGHDGPVHGVPQVDGYTDMCSPEGTRSGTPARPIPIQHWSYRHILHSCSELANRCNNTVFPSWTLPEHHGLASSDGIVPVSNSVRQVAICR